jgi:hypothetical protein
VATRDPSVRIRRDPEVRRLRARTAALARHHKDEPDVACGERQQLKAARAQQYITQLVDAWPPLSPAQKNRLAVLLLGGGDAGAGEVDDGAR